MSAVEKGDDLPFERPLAFKNAINNAGMATSHVKDVASRILVNFKSSASLKFLYIELSTC